MMTLEEMEVTDLSRLSDEQLEEMLAHSKKMADNECHQIGIDYNIKDVELVDRLEEKLGLIQLVLMMAYMGGVNYTDTLGTTAIWDSIIFRKLANKNIIVPFQPSPPSHVPQFAGGYVKDVQEGMHEWVLSSDVNSEYPNLIVQYNMSPETYIAHTKMDVNPDLIINRVLNDQPIFEEDPEVCVAANGACFRKDIKGIIPLIVEDLYERRVKIKKEAGKNKKALEETKAELEAIQKELRSMP